MKYVKKAILLVVVLLLVNFISLFIMSFHIKGIFINNNTKKIITSNMIKYDSTEIMENEKLKELLESEGVQKLINDYIELTFDNISNEEEINVPEIEKDFYNYIVSHKEEIEESLEIEITDEALENAKTKIEDHDVSNAYKSEIINIKRNMTKEEKLVMKIFKILTSNYLKIILFLGIAILVVIIGIIELSLLKTTKLLLFSIETSCLINIIIAIALNIIVSRTTELNFISTNSLLKNSIIIGIISLLLQIIIYITEKKIKKAS
ncbi:MAG: hypothetical protein IJ842_06180 [Bacilli bacterium]|nr:hypothetical protein [Bacilli bacterium]